MCIHTTCSRFYVNWANLCFEPRAKKTHNLCRKFQDGVYPCNNSSTRRKDVTPGTFWFLVSLECLMGILHFLNLSLTSAIFRSLLCRHSFWVTSICVTMSLYCLFYFVIVIPYRPNPRRREKNELNFYEGLHKTFWGTTKKCENENYFNTTLRNARDRKG